MGFNFLMLDIFIVDLNGNPVEQVITFRHVSCWIASPKQQNGSQKD
jgi:hypothetical protein